MARLRLKPAALAAALLLGACATVPPGEDELGAQLTAQTRPVLVALAAYRKDKGRYPDSLYELTPRYLPELPMRPNLDFDRLGQRIGFVYEIAGLRFRQVACTAEFGQVDWACRALE